jgi:hypothetical protein
MLLREANIFLPSPVAVPVTQSREKRRMQAVALFRFRSARFMARILHKIRKPELGAGLTRRSEIPWCEGFVQIASGFYR